MDLNNDCWLLVIGLLYQADSKALHSFRQTSVRFRSLCDPLVFNTLRLDLDDGTGAASHFLRRLQRTHDSLRFHVRHLQITGDNPQSAESSIHSELRRALKRMGSRKLGPQRLQTFKWCSLVALPDFLLDTLETYLPRARLYADAKSYGLLRHGQNAEMSDEVLELSRRLTRLFAYPLLHSFTTSAIVPNKTTEGHDLNPFSLEFLKRRLCGTPSLRELDLTLQRPQDRPHFAFEDGESFPPLEALRLDFSHIFHGQSHIESLELWGNHMDWMALKSLKLEAVSQTQSLAICNSFQGKLPSLKELSIIICGSIGPIDIDLVHAWIRFLEPLEKLESLSLIADFPNFNHWPSLFRIPRLRHLTHRLPESFLVSRYPLLASGNLFTSSQGLFNLLESLSLDADLTSRQTWPWAKFDSIACLPRLSELDIRTHLSAQEFTVMDPQQAQLMVAQLFTYISARKVKDKLHSVRCTFRISIEHLPGRISDQKAWELKVRCSLPDRDDEVGTVKSQIENDSQFVQRLTDAVDEHRRKVQTEHDAKRRRSDRPNKSSECSIEHSGPLIDIMRSETWEDRTP